MNKSTSKKTSQTVSRPAKKTETINRLKGMKDTIPEEWKYWRIVIDKALQMARIYDFERIETPLLEAATLFEKTHGKNNDVITQELYNFVDKSGDRVALRPQMKSSLARLVIEHNLIDETRLLIKTCQLGPLFRHVKMQNNYFRQHTQWNLDIIGEAGSIADVQLIQIADNFFKELQLETQLEINSIGDADCQAEYRSKLTEYYRERTKKIKLPLELKKQITKDPIAVLLSNEESLLEINEEAPQIIDFLSEEAKSDFFMVIEYLDALGIAYNLNPRLFGSFDYHHRTVFEFILPEEEGRKELTLATGNRYSALFERVFNTPMPAVGLSVGIDRTVNRIRNLNLPLEDPTGPEIYLAQLGDTARQKAMNIFEELRKGGFRVSQGFLHNGLKRQLEEAEKLKVRFTLVLGQKELMDGTIIIRDMESSAQEVVDSKKIISELEKRLKV